ncbi:MAG: type III-B CRISPR module-associated protein Cmr5 [Bacteroidales bacterium]|nr:type III-B CRISPR module-associated protein Cmr5 [Bacteroidales bacterium]
MGDNNGKTGIEQGRAKFAYDEVNKSVKVKDYKSHVKKVPMMIKTNGLGATLAFLYSKQEKDAAYKEIGKQITDWLNEKDEKYKRYYSEKAEDFQALVEQVVKINSQEYRALTIEVLALFNWLRRFAEGMIDDSEETNDG